MYTGSMPQPKCEDCGQHLQGNGRFCIACWQKRMQLCHHCMRLDAHNDPQPIRRKGKKVRDTCHVCHGDGWIFRQ